MKTLLIKTLAFAAVLLPLSQVQAKTFGSFTPNKTFTLTVSLKESFKTNLSGVKQKSGVPKGVPNFKLGQKVKFKIGSKGQLTGPGFSIAYVSSTAASDIVNVYQDPKKPKPSTRKVSFGQIFVFDGLPQSGGLDFTVINVNGTNTSTTRVVYGFGD